MTTRDSFPYLIDNIFGEFEMASQVRIDCIAVEKNIEFHPAAPIRVVAINGMDPGLEFLHQIRHLKSETLQMFRNVIPHVSQADLDNFVDLAMRRIRRMARAVSLIGFDPKEKSIDKDSFWSVEQMQCFVEGTESDDALVYLEAMFQTSRPAWVYYLELKKLEERIRSLAGGVIFLPATTPGVPVVKQYEKFRLNCSVSFLGAWLRMACDRDLIERPNISGLCRHFSENYCTARQENISPRSLRNHIDNPSPEALEEVMMDLHSWGKYGAKFIEQQRR